MMKVIPNSTTFIDFQYYSIKKIMILFKMIKKNGIFLYRP